MPAHEFHPAPVAHDPAHQPTAHRIETDGFDWNAEAAEILVPIEDFAVDVVGELQTEPDISAVPVDCGRTPALPERLMPDEVQLLAERGAQRRLMLRAER